MKIVSLLVLNTADNSNLHFLNIQQGEDIKQVRITKDLLYDIVAVFGMTKIVDNEVGIVFAEIVDHVSA